MTEKKQEQPAIPEKHEHRKQDAKIGNRVMHALGKPHDWHRVEVRKLWGDHYRVNVFVGVDGASAKVAHSYFLVVDAEGNIATCNPQITKHY